MTPWRLEIKKCHYSPKALFYHIIIVRFFPFDKDNGRDTRKGDDYILKQMWNFEREHRQALRSYDTFLAVNTEQVGLSCVSSSLK